MVAGNSGIEAMIRHHAMVYRDLADPVRLLKDPEFHDDVLEWYYAQDDDDDTSTMTNRL